MDFLINFLGLVASLAILIWGADKFVDNSSLIAKKIGVSELTIGLTIVALGTSAPEIFVGIGISFLPKKTPMIQLMPFLVSALILGYVLIDLNVSKFDGILLLLSFFYFLYVINANKNSQTLIDEQQDKNNLITFIFLIIGLISLIFGSRYAVIYAEKIAILLNISELIIGLTIIAIGTSLPELAATISAVLKKKTDLVVGNVIGSNVLNITLVVPIIGFFSNVQLDQVLLSRDYTTMISATIIFILVVLFYSNKVFSIKLIRFIGVLFVSCYILYLLILSNLI